MRRRVVALLAGAAMTVATAVVFIPSSNAATGPVTLAAACTAPAWAEGNTYSAGTQVTYANRLYQALVTHTAHPGAGWNPAAVPSLWRDLGACTGGPTTPPPTTPPPTTPPPTTPPPTTPPPTTPPPTTPPPTTPPPTTPPPTTPPPTTPPPSSSDCTATYKLDNSWGGGYQATVTVTAGTSALRSWNVRLGYGSTPTIQQAWNATVTASGTTATAVNAGYNGALAPGASTTFGFIASGTSSTPTLTCAGAA